MFSSNKYAGYPVFFVWHSVICLCTSNLHALHFSVSLLFLILQFNVLVVHSLIALDLAFCNCLLFDGGFGAVWVFGHLGRFSFVIWSVSEFSYFEICFDSFCSDLKFILSFSVCLKISAKFLLFYCATSWIFTQGNLI